MAALSTVWASAAWTTIEMLATWWVRKAPLVDARPSPYCVRSVAPGSRVEMCDEAVPIVRTFHVRIGGIESQRLTRGPGPTGSLPYLALHSPQLCRISLYLWCPSPLMGMYAVGG